MYTAFVTGCSSGFGFLLARTLLHCGHRVVATSPSLEGGWVERLDPRDRSQLLVLPLDVRDAGEVRDAAAEAIAWAPVDVLVNNGGYAVFGSQEEADLEAVRDMLDVNVLGPARVTQALLPSLRASRGTIVQLSSVAGRTVFTESGFYAASKHAIEALTEALHQETATFGIRLRLVQPGSFDTGFLARAARESRPRDPSSPYAHLHPAWDERKLSVLEPPQDPALVVAAIIGSLADPAPFLRIPVGPDAARILAVKDLLGADGWSRLAGDRAGARAEHGPGQVPHPDELLAWADGAISAAELEQRLAMVRRVAELGHLEHWEMTEAGRRALGLVRR